ncbi:response regulator [Aequorivita sp. F47161]|uniref:Response regulator n=1 Tax=Aequorivita vitellina TaxID=2874475 RepID=A0A9X1QVR7_9FLAO|nr:response regulator [Aequorivita vitellina]MCG2418831.1 response regulator [Aequorivita vitellina]
MNNIQNICIIDDDSIYQYAVTATIKAYKLADQVLVFSDGEEALDFIRDNIDSSENLPDVILLDLNMPVMDGFQFMDEYKLIKPKVGKKISVYMVSSSVDPQDVEKAKQISEISDYIIKPIKPKELASILSAIV